MVAQNEITISDSLKASSKPYSDGIYEILLGIYTVISSMNTVDTVVKLKSITGTDSQPAAIVGGYWAIGDEGGGVFYWDTSSSSGDNGVTPTQPGTIIVPNGSTSGRWVRIYSGPINVKWFGARGQGTDNDDAPAINKAISVAGVTPSAVFIPRGIYRLNAPLNLSFPSVRLYGESKDATILQKAGPSADTIVFNSKSRRCQVAQLSIVPLGGSQTSGAAIRFSEPIKPAPSLINLSDLFIEAFQGIIVEGSGFERGMVIPSR